MDRSISFFVPNEPKIWESLTPPLRSVEFCSPLVRGGPLDLPKIHKYGHIDSKVHMTSDDQKTYIDSDFTSWMFQKYGAKVTQTHGIVKPTEASMVNQLKKFGEEVEGKPDPKYWKMADQAVREELSTLVGQCRFTQFDDVELNMSAANGKPLDKSYRDKGEAIVGAYNLLKWWTSEGWKTAPPQYVKATGKVERLSIEEINELKCRMFQPDPIQVVILQAMVNQDIVHKFKDLKGTMSAYGFNKWGGGWDALFKRIKHMEHFFAGDVSRWDKSYQDYHHDANTELKKTFIRDDHRELFNTDAIFDWLNVHAKNLHLLLWTGDVVRLDQGQGSGRFCTTFDNILTHMRVLYYHYFRVRGEYALELPTHTWEIKEFYDCFCFGDDSCGGTTEKLLASFDERLKSYADCGFKLKLEDDFQSCVPLGMPFLGAKVGLFRDKFVFLMNPSRVCGSLTALAKVSSLMERFERTFQIFLNCVFTEEKFPFTQVPTWRVLYERVVDMRRRLPEHDLGSYSTILSVDVYRRYALGLESNVNIAIKDLPEEAPLPFFNGGGCFKIGGYHPGLSRDKINVTKTNVRNPYSRKRKTFSKERQKRSVTLRGQTSQHERRKLPRECLSQTFKRV